MDTPPTPIEAMLSDNALLTSNRITVAGCQESGGSSLWLNTQAAFRKFLFS